MNIFNWIMLMSPLLLSTSTNGKTSSSKNKRYLLVQTGTQWGVAVTVSMPLEESSLTSISWYLAANYYPVSNATYWHPLLGDSIISRNREKRHDTFDGLPIITRFIMYNFIESMLDKYGYHGAECLHRAICESGKVHTLHNGVVGDLLHILLTPSLSEPEEDIEDSYYEAELRGILDDCSVYYNHCPLNPLQFISTVFGE